MSIYDYRDRPAYSNFIADPAYCTNPHVLKWWTPGHDDLLAQRIEEEQWNWPWRITDAIVKMTSSETIETWKREDPKCSAYAWYNVLMYFAMSRADSIGLSNRIRQPENRICPLCHENFREDSLPAPLVQRLGVHQLDFCAPCLRDTVLQGTGNDSLPQEQVLEYLREVADVAQRIPHQNFGEGMEDLRGLGTDQRLALLRLLQRKPTVRRVKDLFGSWLKALIEAGVLDDGAWRTGRGTRCLAIDGHVCLSLAEKTIDDYLFRRSVVHIKEPHYPEGNWRADFSVDGVLIEYFGLAGDADYDARIREKHALAKKYHITLVPIYANDLVDPRKLDRLLERFVKTAK